MSTMRTTVWLAIGVLCAADVCAAPRDPRVVWAGGSSVVVAARDSIAASAGDSVHFAWKGRPIASGTIATLVDRVVAVVRLDAGTLGTRTLDRIDVRIARGARPAARLRVGQPGVARRGARCGALAPGDATYAVRTSYGATDLLTARAADAGGAWPDTLEVRFFDDAVDEEIALRRGEIDVAVFGPGELSPSMRRETPAADIAWGSDAAAGVIAVWTRDPSAPATGPWLTGADQRAFDGLARGHFQGDLVAHDVRRAVADSATAARQTRYEVDPSCPGAPGIAAALPRVDAARARVIRLGWLDVAAGASDSALVAAVGRLDSGAGMPRVAVLFTPRFAVVAGPTRRGDVAATGADRLARLYHCVPEVGR